VKTWVGTLCPHAGELGRYVQPGEGAVAVGQAPDVRDEGRRRGMQTAGLSGAG